MSSFNVSWMHMAGITWLIELTVTNVDSEQLQRLICLVFYVSWMHMAGITWLIELTVTNVDSEQLQRLICLVLMLAGCTWQASHG